METLRSHRSLSALILIISYFHFLPPHLASSAYTLPSQFFINCGSDNITRFGPRSFSGDASFVSGSSAVLKDNTSTSGTELYQTARVFNDGSVSYGLRIDKAGTYMTKLHFFAFSSPANLTKALFNVSADGFSLLSNFSIPQNSTNSPVVKEYLLSIKPGTFRIWFTPCHEQSFAFVNAIEVFIAPDEFLPNDPTHFTSVGTSESYTGLLSKAVHTIYRVNVGGEKLTAENDTMLRDWIPDDAFITNPEAAMNKRADGIPTEALQALQYIAPAQVYKTAKVLNTNQSGNSSKTDWSFKVRTNGVYFVRVHFFDVVSKSPDVIKFNLYFNGKFVRKIYPYNVTGSSTFPFKFDFVVDPDSLGFLVVSVGLDSASIIQSAFLNGLEIMEVMEKTGLDPDGGQQDKKKQPVGFWLGGSIGISIILLLLVLVLVLVLKTKGVILKDKTRDSLDPKVKLALTFPYSEILRATNNFDQKMYIAEGGFGKVYKGTLRDGRKVAVKRSEPGHGQGSKEFETEIKVLFQIRHQNLVSLVGYCDERKEMILVYEYMENGTLRSHLYFSLDDNPETSCSQAELAWEQRLQICIDAAEGLHYLHSGLTNPIFHRDVKSTNILLGEDYRAKVADFGLSGSSPQDPDREFTDIKGSVGYMDPEYVTSLQYTEKSDVYSFGVVLLETLCAKSVIVTSDSQVKTSLAEWGLQWLVKGQPEQVIDPALKGKISPDSLRKFGETVQKCLSRSGAGRPQMREVLWDLQLALRYQKGVASDELPGDSLAGDSLVILPWQVVQHLPSANDQVKESEFDHLVESAETSLSMPSGVFSQLRTSGGR